MGDTLKCPHAKHARVALVGRASQRSSGMSARLNDQRIQFKRRRICARAFKRRRIQDFPTS